jgi:two-component system sensor histidine kinase UhpB
MVQVASPVKPIGIEPVDPGVPRSSDAHDEISTRPSPDLRTIFTCGAPLLAACLLGQLLPNVSVVPGLRLHVLWLPGPLLLGWLLCTPRAAWRTCVLAACAGTVLGAALVPDTAVVRLLASLGEIALVLGVAALLLRWRGAHSALEGYLDIAWFLLLACIALPLCSAGWQQVVGTRAIGALPHPDLRSAALCGSVSYLLIVPAVVSLARLLRSPERRHGWHWRSIVLAVTLLGALALLWQVDWPPGALTPLLAVAPIPLLVWALIVFGVSGASLSMLVVAVLGMQLGVLGMGPFAAPAPGHDLLPAQAWTLGTGFALLFLGALSEQKLSNHLQLQQAYRRLGEVTGRMLVVQEEERTRIARDLHDDVNQSLAAISIRLSGLRHQVAPSERAAMVELQENLLAVSNDIRSISHELHPSILRFTGLASALDAFCIKRNARGTLRLRCRIEDTPPLQGDQELSLFRIVQEALNNVDRHAQARLAEVLVAVRGQDLVLRVDDDGRGMPAPCSRSLAPGLGMISMEERARLLGGTLAVDRSPLGGTRIEVRFPLAARPHPGDGQ